LLLLLLRLVRAVLLLVRLLLLLLLHSRSLLLLLHAVRLLLRRTRRGGVHAVLPLVFLHRLLVRIVLLHILRHLRRAAAVPTCKWRRLLVRLLRHLLLHLLRHLLRHLLLQHLLLLPLQLQLLLLSLQLLLRLLGLFRRGLSLRGQIRGVLAVLLHDGVLLLVVLLVGLLLMLHHHRAFLLLLVLLRLHLSRDVPVVLVRVLGRLLRLLLLRRRHALDMLRLVLRLSDSRMPIFH
jgi:hypothetical protein